MTKADTQVATEASGNGARLVSNSRWNLIAFGVALVINFATIPIVISCIGLDDFGAGGLVIAIYAPFMLIGTVIGQSMVRELSPRIASGKLEKAAPIFSAGLGMCAVGCAGVVAFLTLAGDFSVHMLSKQGGMGVNWSLAFVVVGAGWAAQQGVLVLQAAIAATQQYASLAYVSVIAALLSATCIVLGSVLLPSYLGFLVGTSVGFLGSLALWIWLVRRLLPGMFPLPHFGRSEIRAIVEFGKWQGGAHFAGAIGNQIDRYVLGLLAPLSVVGQYNVAMRLQEVVHMALLKTTEVLFPHFTVTAGEPVDRRAAFFMQATWVLNVIGVAALAPLIPLSDQLMTLWINKEAADGGAQMLRTLAAAGVLGCGVNVYYFFAIGTGQSVRIASLTVAHAVLTIALTIWAIKTLGAAGAGVGYLIANSIRLCVTLWFAGRHFYQASIMRSLVLFTVPPLAGGLLLAWCWWTSNWLGASNWWLLIAEYALVASSVAFLAVATTAFSKPGRQLIAQTFFACKRIFFMKT